MYPKLPQLKHTDTSNFFLIAGPCVIEDEHSPFEIAERLVEITERLQIPFAFKASYRKANRSRVDSFTGIGDWEGLEILGQIRERLGVPVVTDIHNETEAATAAQFVDVLQIPAFLCRQTSLLAAAAETGKVVNVKKGQFLSPEAMEHAVDKIHHYGGRNIMLTERGATFGYQDLVVDFRSIPIMKRNGVPVVVDITHSLQHPNQPCRRSRLRRRHLPRDASRPQTRQVGRRQHVAAGPGRGAPVAAGAHPQGGPRGVMPLCVRHPMSCRLYNRPI